MSKPIILQPGQHTVVGPSLVLAKVLWSEPPVSGTATVRGGDGTVLCTITRQKGAPEPGPVVFNPPVNVTSGAIHCSSAGGWLVAYVQGASGSGF
jgi:hypothetical protein